MIKSMTGFGSVSVVLADYHHRLEVRSVNSKFIDVKVKVPYDMAGLDIRIQQHIKKVFARGRFEVSLIRDAANADTPRDVCVNWDLAEKYYKAIQSIRHKFGIQQDVNLSMIVNSKEVISLKRTDDDVELMWTKLKDALDAVLKSVTEMRETEGKAIAVDMAGRCNTIKELSIQIEKLAPEVVESYKNRLEQKISAIKPQELDQSRLAQEVLYFADRCDITEEITRLRSHIQQFLGFLDNDEPVGRKIDFLIQEMNREANTIGSKNSSADISRMVVEIKSELEKLREQIQNVE